MLAIWQRRGIVACLLWPLSVLFGWIVAARQYAFAQGLLPSQSAPVPLIIVGNIQVGGTGKTPTVIALARALHQAGFVPAILSRGYGAHLSAPRAVTSTDHAHDVGDEPLLMAQTLASLAIPVWVYPDRIRTIRALLTAQPNINVLISDDGLQHYRLARKIGRDIEIIVTDPRLTGNGWLLPAGPLRESTNRRRDITLSINTENSISPPIEKTARQTRHFVTTFVLNQAWQLIQPNTHQALTYFTHIPAEKLLAAAGIGHPEKFFAALRQHGIESHTLALPDHFRFTENPFAQSLAQYILITEKDAVKCRHLDDPRIWVVPVNALLDPLLIEHITDHLNRIKNG
ncbi:MAG: tetraacyldisaccharide 4'-kinase [Ottowia sp.]|nr:tetraacyldisaccharide 4'-kinase [Ottowia sp.]